MVRVGRRRRAGQAQPNAFPQNAQAINAVPQVQAPNAQGGQNVPDTLLDEAMYETQGNLSGDLDQGPGVVRTGYDDEGNYIVYAEGSGGGETLGRFPQAQPQAPPQQPPAAQCEFEAQSVNLRRDVTITNSTPQIVDARVDVCGNLLGYTESMTRVMTAGDWVPANGSNVVSAEDNGELYLTRFGTGADIANSAGVDDIGFSYDINAQASPIGSRVPANGVPVPNGNGIQNGGLPNAGGARYKKRGSPFAGSMKKYRSA